MPDDSKLNDLKNKSKSSNAGRKSSPSNSHRTHIDPNSKVTQHTPNSDSNPQPEVHVNLSQNEPQNEPQTEAQNRNSSQVNQDSLREIQNNSLSQELDDWKNKSLRLAADLQNLTRQHELDIQQARKNTKRQTITSILTFLNTLQLAFAYAPQTDDEKVSKFLDTLKLSFEQVISELRNQQIEILIPHIGQKVDVEWMNLLTPSDEEHPSVKQVVGLGLKIDSQLVQPASVMV